MTNINFYQISGDQQSALLLACKLTEKAWRQDMQVLIHADPEVVQQLDSLLWSYSDTAFLPHSTNEVTESSIAITCHDDPGEHHGLLISLSQQTPDWFSRFEKVAEIIYDDPEHTASKRNSFVRYKNRGYPLEYYDLGKR